MPTLLLTGGFKRQERVAQCALCEIARFDRAPPIIRRYFYSRPCRHLLCSFIDWPLLRGTERETTTMRILLNRCGDRELFWVLLALIGLIVFTVNS